MRTDEHLGGWTLRFVGGPLDGETLDVGHRVAWPVHGRGLYERRQHEGAWVMLWRDHDSARGQG